MALNDHTRLRGVTRIGRDQLSTQITYGVTEWLRWGLLNIGAFQNIEVDLSGVYGGNRSTLRSAKDINFTDGQVWEGFRSDWVYETGIEPAHVNTPPIQISGVYVGGTFHPLSGVGTFSHYIDYPRGRVVFNTAIATTSAVKAEFSVRTVNIYDYEHAGFQEVMFNSYHVERNDFALRASGNWSQDPLHRVQLPAIGIELVPQRTSIPFELGSQVKLRKQDLMYHVLAENEGEKDDLADILDRQDEKTIWLPNKNTIKIDRAWPLDFRGMTITGFKTFPSIVAATGQGGYRWRTASFTDTTVQNIGEINPDLFGAIVRTTVNVLL